MIARLAAALLLAAVAAPAWGQGFDMASRAGGKGPIEVTAEQGIEWTQDRKLFIARGNAKATRGNVSVMGDTLTAHYRENAGGDTEIYQLDAEGNVTIATPTEKGTGSFATYNMDSAKLLLRGAPARLTTPTDTVTASQSIEYDERTRLATARGDAVAIRGDKRIKSDVLTARFKEDAKGQLVLTRADALGNVVLTTAQDVVTGDKGDYNAETGIATLTGSVKITRDQNQLNGGYAQVNLNTGVSKLFAAPPGTAGASQRVQGIFVPEGDQKQAAPQQAPAAPTPGSRR